jgi:hypothetical protein
VAYLMHDCKVHVAYLLGDWKVHVAYLLGDGGGVEQLQARHAVQRVQPTMHPQQLV